MFGHRTPLFAAVGAVVAVISISATAALAAGSVAPAHGSTRSALVRAFATQDGTTQGIGGVYVSESAGVVCQRTPGAGLVRFLFRHTGRSWRFAFSTRGTAKGTANQRRLEAACH